MHSLSARTRIAALLSLPVAIAQNTISLAPQANPGSSASDFLSPSYAGFGIEPSNLFSFTGGDSPNEFSIQLLQNLADYSGGPAHIRLGGNTQDYMIWEASKDEFRWTANKNSKAQGAIAADSMIIGPGYFKALDRFPKDTPITFGLNMAYEDDDWETHIVSMAQGAVDNLKNTKLYSFEVGNEPDLWMQNGFRAAGWSGKTYTEQFLDRCEAVCNQVLKSSNLPCAFFEPPATASTIGTTFEIAQLVDDGIMTGRNGDNYVTTWNQHDYFYFIGVTPTPITQNDLMDMDQTDTQFVYWAKQVNIALKTGLQYNLREMSSIGPIGMPGVSDTFGASLWTLNFFLYAASLGIESVQMHMTDNSNASAWQPIPMYGHDTTFVRPQYYAHAAVAQLVGNGNGTTQILQLKTSGASSDYTGRIRSYAAYAHDNLQAVVMINSKEANSSSTKGSYTFNLNMGSQNAKKDVYLSYLTAPGAESQTEVTWNGMHYDDVTGNSTVVDAAEHKIRLDDSGRFTVQVRDSQAVVANIGSKLGVNLVLKPDPTQQARKSAASSSMSGSRNAIYTAAVTIILALGMVMC
ncbi:hypothetical protein IQ06DRAFT_244439 [Phaeosphaeriaceae sp. SRC1lsM3a]|nr:hypothetical protein IQ06DRAFT_244439 [Stagonospora sp. SRC1lsM3a]